MRTIKFRGKRLNDREWVYGSLLKHDKIDLAVIVNIDNIDKSTIVKITTSVDPNTIGQFTGLYDKNGEEIYEGDILLWTRKNVHIEGRPLRDFADRCEIFYDDGKCAFRFKYKLDCGSCCGLLDFSDDRADESYIEIVGNIHDNPDLMKGD